MSSSSMSFPPPANPANSRPSKTVRGNQPFVPQASHTPYPPDRFQMHFSRSASASQGSGQAQSQEPSQTAPTGNNDAASKAKPDAKSKDAKATVNPIGFLFPVMTLIGTPMMLVTSLLGINKNKEGELEFNANRLTKMTLGLGKNERGVLEFKPNLLTSRVKSLKSLNATKAEKAIRQALLNKYKLGRLILAMGIIPKTLIGIMYGIQSQQPSILLAHLLQLPLAPMILKEKQTATTLVYLMGGLFTLGFINDIENGQLKEGLKDARTQKPRLYDMTHFKQLFALKSGLSLAERVSGFFSEAGHMLRFSAQDHAVTSKRAIGEINKLLHGQQNELTDLKTTGSISKSSLGFMLSYAATIPALAIAMLPASKSQAMEKATSIISRYSMGTTLLSGLMLNFGMILVALNGKNWAERIPMAGTSMELSGTVAGYSTSSKIQPFALALQQLGGGLNNIFYAHKAQKD